MNSKVKTPDLIAFLEKRAITILNIAAPIVCAGYLIDIFSYSRISHFALYINLTALGFTLFAFSLFYLRKIKIKACYGIMIYVAVASVFSDSLFDPFSSLRIFIFLRDSLFIMIAITLASLFVNKIHALIICALYIIVHLILTVITKDSFLESNIILMFLFVISFSVVIFYFVGVFEKSILMREKDSGIIREQNENLNETNTMLEERQQQIEEQAEILAVQAERLKKQSNQLAKKNDKLKQLNRTKDRFISILAHDLKNPFNTILGFSELLERKYDELDLIKKKKYISAINSASRKTYNLLENLLHWAMAQSGSIQYNPTIIQLNDLIRNNLNFFLESYKAKKIKIIENIDVDCNVFADNNMLDTIIRNLISNAIKYTYKEGEIRINCKKEDNQIVFEIRDTGIGMDKKTCDNLFRIDMTQSTEGTSGETGTGLGLQLCKSFIEKSRGKIWVTSEKDQGSTFSFSLPIAG